MTDRYTAVVLVQVVGLTTEEHAEQVSDALGSMVLQAMNDSPLKEGTKVACVVYPDGGARLNVVDELLQRSTAE